MANQRPDASYDINDPLWYKDAVVYQAHVRTYFDGDGDGMGDFAGLAAKLDYLEDLGVNTLWILPFYPSPWKDDGYDIADYTDVHPAYGTLDDFRSFLDAAHRRGIRVVTELVINHTSDQHPWFQRARRAPKGSVERDFYVWSDTPEKYPEVRIIFQDFETSNWAWDPVAEAYYWHRFYSQQPDLNFDNPAVHEAVFEALDFWFEMGVDGVRLDAIPYLYEREGTNGENLPETHAFLKLLRAHVDARWPNRMLLAEANQWPEDAVAYFGNGDECHMSFHFPVMPRLYMAVQMEDRFPVIDILEQTPPIPEGCQWAMFLRNHDELTLEMVTDEERDYMYRAYAQDQRMRVNLGIRRRLAPLMGQDRRKVELMNGLLFSMPGTPIVYYGDEIGMGDNVYLGDRNGVRTPMQWSADRNAGFSTANPQSLYLPVIIDPAYHYELVNVEAQQDNATSLLWWMKRIIAMRKRFRAFGRGTMRFLHPENRKVLAFVREHEDERVLCVFNLSRFAQHVELDLSPYAGLRPIEMSGATAFPAIGAGGYHLTLGAYGFFWFSLEAERRAAPRAETATGAGVATLAVAAGWDSLVTQPASRARLEEALASYLPTARWFGAKAREIRSVRVAEAVPLRFDASRAYLTLLRVTYTDEHEELYLLPLAAARGAEAERVRKASPGAVIARLRDQAMEQDGGAILYDALADPGFDEALLGTIARRGELRGAEGVVQGVRTEAFRALTEPIAPGGVRANAAEVAFDGGGDAAAAPALTPSLVQGEQSNTSVVYGERLILKLFRRPDEGVNPDLELSTFLNERGFRNTPPLAGALQYRRGRAEPMTLGILQGFVPNEGDAWRYTQDELARFYERVLTVSEPAPAAGLGGAELVARSRVEPGLLESETINYYVHAARLLGTRTAEMHRVLASEKEERAFAPEPFGELYQRSLYQSMRNLTRRTFERLDQRIDALPPEAHAGAVAVREAQDAVLERFRGVVGRKLRARRIRTHGDYHLGQVLYTGNDFVIIDFEGEPARPLGQRRIKRSPLSDVAGMLRSFHYAAWAALFGELAGDRIPEGRRAEMEPWARFWTNRVSAAFLDGYLETSADAEYVPDAEADLVLLLDVYLLEKAIYELGYEMDNRPAWIGIPIQGILELLHA